MIRKASWIAVLGVASLLVGVSSGTHERLADSARIFQQYFHDLGVAGDSVSPLERVVLSLALAGADTRPARK